jgi:transposase
LRRLLPNSEQEYETFYRLAGSDHTAQGHYPLHWIYSTEKKKRDQKTREKQLRKAEADLSELTIKLNVRQLKTRSQIQKRVEQLLHSHGVESFYHIDIGEVEQESRKQIGRGRPTNKTRYETIINTIYTLTWRRNNAALKREKHLDGLFPILCTDQTLTAKAALEAYKYQPRLEKRFYQLKTVHLAAPTLFKKIERVEAMMLLFFLALILQAVIEREVRKQMNASKIKALSIYPEHRLAYHPTTAKIFDRFHDISTYQIKTKDRVVEEYRDELTELQKEILTLLGMTEQDYWYGVI